MPTHKRKIYFPLKYYRGLSTRKQSQRKREIRRFGALSWKNPRAYKGFDTDKGITTKTSSYTSTWKKRFPQATSLEAKAKATGKTLSTGTT
jgi:hypothetical protein